MSAQHTPGPWKASVGACYDQVEAVDGPHICFASMREESKANARAISAVPELLEVVRISIGNVRSLGPAGALEPYTDYRIWLEQLEAAYDKATRSAS